MRKKLFCIVGARPNFMKIAPIMQAIEKSSKLTARLIHTGQHYDVSMKTAFFEQLKIPEPHVDLEVGGGSHAFQTAEIMKRFEPILDEEKPSAILVVGDVNSTIACSLVAAKKYVPVFHVEAGLRSYDRRMPEEINRVLTDQISDLLFTTERNAEDNLLKEGVSKERIHFVGNVMIDTLHQHLPRAVSIENILSKEQLTLTRGSEEYALLTLHRPSNVDSKAILSELLNVISKISERLTVIFPIHPRTKHCIEKYGLDKLIKKEQIVTKEPLGYLEMLGLMSKSQLILTDSGGIQEEATILGVPCLTLRNNTERPITVSEGTNTIVGTDPTAIWAAFEDILNTGGKVGKIPEKWDGKASQRIVKAIEKRLTF